MHPNLHSWCWRSPQLFFYSFFLEFDHYYSNSFFVDLMQGSNPYRCMVGITFYSYSKDIFQFGMFPMFYRSSQPFWSYRRMYTDKMANKILSSCSNSYYKWDQMSHYLWNYESILEFQWNYFCASFLNNLFYFLLLWYFDLKL